MPQEPPQEQLQEPPREPPPRGCNTEADKKEAEGEAAVTRKATKETAAKIADLKKAEE